ncbi:MAG TPA: nuclear transport factor 2 family protein, partial [Xanthomonadales bacterium]|nr:nuclear transport factor 2 family protein [Xanthomonadales bacterium]
MHAMLPLLLALAASDDAATLRELVAEGAAACMAGRADDVVAHYSRDIVLSYPGVPDHGYDEILASYRTLCAGAGVGTVESTVPTFEEVLVSGDLGVVRVTWTTHLRGMPDGATRQLRDLQVWR